MNGKTKRITAVIIAFAISLSLNLFTYAAGYNPSAAIAYADKYALSYNTSYKNYNSNGGDCANFVSQCLYAGGLEQTDGWYYKSSSSISNSWVGCTSQMNYLVGKGYKLIKNPTASQILPGNPVYYYSSGSSTPAHVAICVGKDSSGVPIIDAHNNDRYHRDWQLGGSSYWSGYATVLINTGSLSAATTTKAATTASSLNEQWKVTATSLNLRSGAGTSNSVYCEIPNGTVIKVTERKTVSGAQWGKTTYGGYTGWCSLDYAIQITTTTTKSTTSTKATTTTTKATTSTTKSGDVLLGDANGDGVLNSKDVLTIRKYNSEIEVYIVLQAGDINGDGVVNSKDVLMLKKYNADQISMF